MNHFKRIFSGALCAYVSIASIAVLGAVPASAANESEFRHFFFSGETFSSDENVDLWYSVGGFKKMPVSVNSVPSIGLADTIKLWVKTHKGHEYTEPLRVNVFTEEYKWSNEILTLSDEDMAKLTSNEGYTVNIKKDVIDRFNEQEGENYTIADMVLEFELPGNETKEDDEPESPETIAKKKNPLKIKLGKSITIDAKKLKKSSYKFVLCTVTKAAGKVKITLDRKNSSIKNNMTINKSTGEITLKKGDYRKGVHKLNITIHAAGNQYYKEFTKHYVYKLKIK